MFRVVIISDIFACDIKISNLAIESFLKSVRENIVQFKKLRDIDQDELGTQVIITKL